MLNDSFVMGHHVAAEYGERDENGGGEDRLAEFLPLIENCISTDQLGHSCLIIVIVRAGGMIMIDL